MTINWLVWLSTDETDQAAESPPSAPQWSAIACQAERHQLAPLLYQRVRALHLEASLPPPLLHHLRQVYAAHLKTSSAQQHELAACRRAQAAPIFYREGAKIAKKNR